MFEMSLDEAELNSLYAEASLGTARSPPSTTACAWVVRPAATGGNGGTGGTGGLGEDGLGGSGSARAQGRAREGAGRGVVWSTGVVSLQGIRERQEDQYTVIEDLNAALQLLPPPEQQGGDKQAFFAIYDGHCGIQAAEYAKVPPTHTDTHREGRAAGGAWAMLWQVCG